MINAINDVTIQQFVRSGYNAEIFDKDLEAQKNDKVRKQRPVEKINNGRKSEMNLRSQEDIKSRNCLEDGQLIVEKYDKDGRLIKKIPPGFLPFGEIA